MPTSPTPSPLAYERPGAEAIPGVCRDGKYLVVNRGGNLSGFCLRCGRPSAGTPLVKHLWAERPNPFHTTGNSGGSGGGVIGAIILVIQLIVLLCEIVWAVTTLISEARASRKRTVAFGLCSAHRRQRVVTITAAWVAAGLGCLFLVFAIATTGHKTGPWLYSSILAFIFGPLLWALAVFLAMSVPGPKLFKEQAKHLWLKGASEEFLSAQPTMP
jgi:hypothetical protein